jgi:parvulin-like peptidyl-prolyl isomerase
VVARVNGQNVVLMDIVPLAKPILDKAADREQARPRALREALDQYVGREVLFQEAQRRGLSPDSRTLEEAYNQARLRYPDEKDWENYLLKQGFSPTSFKRELRIQATVALLGAAEAEDAKEATDAEAEAYYEANKDEFRFDKLKVRQILLRVIPPPTDQQRAGQRARAETLLFRVRRGESFADLARAFSEDEQSREKGGELPAFTRGEADPALEAAAFALKPGEVSEVVETKAGLHILELVSRSPGGLPPYEAVEGMIKRYLQQEQRAERVRQLEARLRAQARVETYL